METNQATLKGDAKEGYVQLKLHDGTSERTLTRAGNPVTVDDDGYLNDPEVGNSCRSASKPKKPTSLSLVVTTFVRSICAL